MSETVPTSTHDRIQWLFECGCESGFSHCDQCDGRRRLIAEANAIPADITVAFMQAAKGSLRATVTYLESASMLFKQADQGLYVNLAEDVLSRVQAIIDTIPETQA